MKRRSIFKIPIFIFIVVLLSCLVILGFWIYWFISGEVYYHSIVDLIDPELKQRSNSILILVSGSILLCVISAGLIFIFTRLVRQLRMTRLYDNFILNVTRELKLSAQTKKKYPVKNKKKLSRNLEELFQRLSGIMKPGRMHGEQTDLGSEYSFGDNTVNFAELKCKTGERKFRLTELEASLLKYLVDNRGRTVSREELLSAVWHIRPDTDTRTLDVFIMRLRKYFESDPGSPVFFRNVRGAGYIFSPTSEEGEALDEGS